MPVSLFSVCMTDRQTSVRLFVVCLSVCLSTGSVRWFSTSAQLHFPFQNWLEGVWAASAAGEGKPADHYIHLNMLFFFKCFLQFRMYESKTNTKTSVPSGFQKAPTTPIRGVRYQLLERSRPGGWHPCSCLSFSGTGVHNMLCVLSSTDEKNK